MHPAYQKQNGTPSPLGIMEIIIDEENKPRIYHLQVTVTLTSESPAFYLIREREFGGP